MVGTAVCALLLAAFGTVFGVHRYNTELRNNCAAAVSAADQAVDDYVSAVTATEPVLRSADDTPGYKESEGASELVGTVSGVDRQVRMDLTCTDRGQLETLRSATAELGTKRDALATDTLRLTVSISSYNNTKAANELSIVVRAAQSIYDGSAEQLPAEGVRGELRAEIDEATALLDAAAAVREQAAGDNDPAPVDESTRALGDEKIELSTKKDDTAKAAGIASEQAAEQQEAQQAEPDQPADAASESGQSDSGGSAGGSGGVAGNGGGSNLNPRSGGGPNTSNGSGSHGSNHESDDDEDEDEDDDDGYWEDGWPPYRSCHWVLVRNRWGDLRWECW